MKHITLVISLFLCIPHTSYAMEITQKNTNPSDATLLCLQGIAKNNPNQVKIALLAGADVNHIISDGKSLFYLACEKNSNEEIYKLLITHENIDINSRNSYSATPLYVACELGLTTTVASMLSKAPQTANICSRGGSIPLHVAAYHGKKDCVTLFLSHDIRTSNHQDYGGFTALHQACNVRQLDTIKLLIEKDADPTIKNNYQVTPLTRLFSVCYDDLNLFYSFLADNPSVAKKIIHKKDKQKNNQFHLCATIQGILEPKFDSYLLFLASHNLDINARNNEGKRAVDLAYEKYTKLYNFYTIEKLHNMYKDVTNQEQVMHAFLRFISPHTPCALFKTMLEQQSANGHTLPEELLVHIIRNYYELNIETIVAKKYKHNKKYYDDYIENKNQIKQQLLAKPELHLLWSAS